MKKLLILPLLLLLFACKKVEMNTPTNDNVIENEISYYNGIEIIDIDKFYEIKDENDFIIYLYSENIYSSDVINSIVNYSNLLGVSLYAININTIYTNNILEDGLFDDNYYFSNNDNDGKTSITNINRYGNEAILEFSNGKIKYTFSETNVISKMKTFEELILDELINKMKMEIISSSIEYFNNEANNYGKESVRIETLINRFQLNNVLADLYKDYYILQSKEGIYNDDLNTICSDEYEITIKNNTYKICQYSNFSFIIN